MYRNETYTDIRTYEARPAARIALKFVVRFRVSGLNEGLSGSCKV
jgi:hypothetical protein